MPDAKSLLPGRAFRSEHAQLRPEPHSIASHGPAPMDPLQTTRMRNGVLYAAEWPCCHDPLRLSLGSEDPFSQPTRSARAVAHPLKTRVRARRARRVRAPPPRAGRRAPNAPSFPLPPLSPLSLCLRARCPLAAGASKAPSAHASRVGGRAASPLLPTARVCASCPTHPDHRNAGGRAAPPRLSRSSPYSPLLASPPQPLACVLRAPRPPTRSAPLGKRVCHACPRRSAPTESSGGLNARRSHPLHPPHQTPPHHTSLEPPPPRTLMHTYPSRLRPRSLALSLALSLAPPATRRLHAA